MYRKEMSLFPKSASHRLRETLRRVLVVALLVSSPAGFACPIDYAPGSKADEQDNMASFLGFRFRQVIGSFADSDSRKIVQVNRRFHTELGTYPTGKLTDIDPKIGNVATIILFKDGNPVTAIYAHSKVDGFAFSHLTGFFDEIRFEEHEYKHPDRFPARISGKRFNSISGEGSPHSEPIAIDLLYDHVYQLGGNDFNDAGWTAFFDKYDELRLFTERPPCGSGCTELVSDLRAELLAKSVQLGRSGQFQMGVSHNYDTRANHLSQQSSGKKFSRMRGKYKWVNQRASDPPSGLTRMDMNP